MTIDKAKLKALAEAAPTGPWYGPDELAHKGTVFDCDLGSLLSYESIESERDACVAYVAAANPATVLELIAEIKRSDSRLNDVAVLCATVEQERDQLKAENERLANIVGDFCILTKRFVHRLRKAAPDNDLPEQALDYLKRKGLQGSPMRAEESSHD